MNPQPRIRVLRQTEGALLLDGDRSHVVGAMRAMRWCIERARESKGMVVAGVRNSQLIVPGFYARMGAEAGLIGFACANAVPMVAPPGGRSATFGTNPLAYAIPAGRYPPVVLDVATTTGAAFKVRLAALYQTARVCRALPCDDVSTVQKFASGRIATPDSTSLNVTFAHA
jgi:LDH2 family malate/lactate/ureidoglycolate dehydrogenase